MDSSKDVVLCANCKTENDIERDYCQKCFRYLYSPKIIPFSPEVEENIFADGIAEHQQGRLDKAFEIYRKVQFLNPYRPELIYNMGLIFDLLGNDRKAEEYMITVIKLNHAHCKVYISAARWLYSKGFRGLTREALLKVMKINPAYIEAYIEMGRMYLDVNFYDAAEYFFKKALNIEPDSVSALMSMALLFSSKKRWDKALWYYRQCVYLGSFVFNAFLGIASCYIALGKYMCAKRLLDYLVMVSDGADVRFYRGIMYQSMGDLESAEAEYLASLNYNKGHSQSLYNLATIYFESKRYEKAAEVYKSILKILPDSSDVLYNLGLVYAKLGKMDEAEVFYKRSLEIKPDYLPAINNLGYIYISKGNYIEAKRLFQKALEIDPHYIKARVNMCVVCAKLGLYKELKMHYKFLLKEMTTKSEIVNVLLHTLKSRKADKLNVNDGDRSWKG